MYLHVTVTQDDDEVVFRLKETVLLGKMMKKFCERTGRVRSSTRFLYEGTLIADTDTPLDVRLLCLC